MKDLVERIPLLTGKQKIVCWYVSKSSHASQSQRSRKLTRHQIHFENP